MSRRLARIRLSTELFLSALAFPEGTRLLLCRLEDGGQGEIIELLVGHDDLPETDVVIPVITPQITEVGPRPAEYLAFDWNLPAEGDEDE